MFYIQVFFRNENVIIVLLAVVNNQVGVMKVAVKDNFQNRIELFSNRIILIV